MKRHPFRIAVLLLVFPCGAGAQEKPQPETPTFPARVELVTVDAVVADKKGSPVTGLTRDDFTLTEDGVRQAIESFEAIQAPAAAAVGAAPAIPRVSTNALPQARTARTFVIVFDDVHLTLSQARRAKIAVAELLKAGIREGDRVTLVSTGGDAWWTARMAAGRDELIALLKRLEGRLVPDTSPERMSDYEAMRVHVFSDQLVEQRVRRRFETYGASPRETVRREIGDPVGDPMVRARASEIYFQAVSRNRITLQLMERVLNSLAVSRGRKTMILVSEGFIYDPNLDDFKRVKEASRRSNCAIYFLDTRGLGGIPVYFGAEFGPAMADQDVGSAFSETFEASEGADSLASDSGGFSVKNTNDLSKGIQRIADESRIYYLLGYHPTNATADGRFRKIQVKVNRKGVEVRARKGYYAPLEGGKAIETKKPQKTDPAFQEALDSPYELEEVPLRMTAYVFEETLLGKARVVVAADVDLRGFSFEEQDGRFLDTLEFLLVAAHRETGEFFQIDQKVEMKLLPETREKLARSWLPILREFELAAGRYQAKLVVRDKRSGRMGSVIHEFDVPDLSQLRASTPVLSDALQPVPEGSQSAPRASLLTRRSFAPGATLYCQFEVYGAAKDKATGMPRVSAGYVVRRPDGSVLTTVESTPIKPTSLGRLSRLVGTPLEGAAPGEYEFVLSLKDELAGKALELREPFSVGGAS